VSSDAIERKQAEEALREGARQHAALYRFVARLHRADSLPDIYNVGLDGMLDALRCDRASVLVRDAGGVMRFVGWRHLSEQYRQAVEGHSPWTPDDVNPQPVCISSVAEEPLDAGLKACVMGEGIGALGFFPLIINGKLGGKFMTYYNEPHVFADVELDLCFSIARQLALGIERRQAEQTLRASEQRLRLALDAGRMGSWEWNLLTGDVDWSPELEAIHGLAPGTFEGTFEAYQKDIHPDDHADVQRAIADSLDRNDHHLEYRIVLPDGSIRWVEGRGKVFRDDAGTATRLVGVCTDITERKRSEQTLKEADRRKDEFLATLAHELRNPLAPIRTGVDILGRLGILEPKFDHVRSMMDRQVKQLTRLVDDLLDVSRITRNKIELRKRATPLAEIVALAVEISQPTIDFHRHRLTVDLPREPLVVNADPARLAQAFANLLNNAAKYSGEHNRIDFHGTREGDSVILRVRDYGVGISSAMLPRVFDMFAQADDSLTHAQGGLGIGLTIVKALVEMHEGTVRARSAGPGMGSEFEVTLPISVATADVASPTTGRAPGRISAPRARRVLMVDDNIDAATSLSMLLAMQGHDVRTANDARSALHVVESYTPDVVLLDIGLPGQNGYDLAREMRAMPLLKDVLLVATTGFGQEQDRRRAEDAGFDVHLVKPVDPDVLNALLAEPARGARASQRSRGAASSPSATH
jgi:PAS domain S-box-containing protein